MKSALLVFGVFMIVAAVTVYGWSSYACKPTNDEKSLLKTIKFNRDLANLQEESARTAINKSAFLRLADQCRSDQRLAEQELNRLVSQRENRRSVSHLIIAITGVFSIVSFVLALTLPSFHRPRGV